MDSNQIGSSGDIHIHGDANIGGDFAGRDSAIGGDQLRGGHMDANDRETISRIMLALYGDKASNFPGIIDRVASNAARLEEMDDQLKKLLFVSQENRRLTPLELAIWGLYSGVIAAGGAGIIWLSVS